MSKQGLHVFLARMVTTYQINLNLISNKMVTLKFKIMLMMKEDRFADLDDIMSDQKVDFILDNEKAVPRYR